MGAQHISELFVGRVLQGMGGAGVMVLTVITLSDFVPLGQRGIYIAALNGVWTVGSVCGPIVGGAFAKASWVRDGCPFQSNYNLTLRFSDGSSGSIYLWS